MKVVAFLIITATCFVSYITCPPVKEDKKPAENATSENNIDHLVNLEYERYLKEIVQVLESDPDFRKKLETANPDDIRSGQIAHELDTVGHKVRTQLDEIKRTEIRRLKELRHRETELQHGLDRRVPGKVPTHIDHSNPHTFEIEDLKKLIIQTTNDLEAADLKRRDDFKEYEMKKKHDRLEKMAAMDEEHRKKAQEQYEMERKKHMEHPKVHHPGSKDQLEEVWEEQDHMRPEDFEPKTFFAMHDLDGDGYWDPEEVNALFQKELNKVYTPGAKEDDMRERIEEMERMREHIFNETDRNRDKLISIEEFLQQSRQEEFERDPGWETLDDQKLFTSEEFEEYERRQQELMRQQGIHPPPPHGMPPHGVPPPGYGGHPNQVPQQHPYQQAPPQQQQYQYQQVPNQQYQQVPNQQYHQQVPPNQQQQYQQQVPNQQQGQQQQYQQPPQQYQQVPQQVPQQPYQQSGGYKPQSNTQQQQPGSQQQQQFQDNSIKNPPAQQQHNIPVQHETKEQVQPASSQNSQQQQQQVKTADEGVHQNTV